MRPIIWIAAEWNGSWTDCFALFSCCRDVDGQIICLPVAWPRHGTAPSALYKESRGFWRMRRRPVKCSCRTRDVITSSVGLYVCLRNLVGSFLRISPCERADRASAAQTKFTRLVVVRDSQPRSRDIMFYSSVLLGDCCTRNSVTEPVVWKWRGRGVYRRPFASAVPASLAGNPVVLPSPEKKTLNLGLAEMQFPAVLRGLLALFSLFLGPWHTAQVHRPSYW